MGTGIDRVDHGCPRAPLNETGVSLSQLSARNKQVEMEFYLPISEPLIASQLDTLIRQFDPLSAGCPPLEFMQVRGMLKALSTGVPPRRALLPARL